MIIAQLHEHDLAMSVYNSSNKSLTLINRHAIQVATSINYHNYFNSIQPFPIATSINF